LTTPYTRPNIIDIKLGTVLFDAEDKSITEEKRVKMEAKARVRASGVVGAAITGFQVRFMGPLIGIGSGKALMMVVWH
jgi:1D-myo-inositol-tetrakisphosphate 5-kinase/inositol-polyphosphate multikinase